MVKRDLTLSEQHVWDKVSETIAAYDEMDQRMRDRLCEYLVIGDDATCLLELAAAYQVVGRKRFFKQSSTSAVQPVDRIAGRKLMGLFQISTAPAGYYRRLGEVAGQVPEVKHAQAKIESDARLSPWLRDLVILRGLLAGDSGAFYYYATRSDGRFQLQPWLRDLESPEAVAHMIAMVVGSDDTPYNHIARNLQSAGDCPAILTSHPAEFTAALQGASAHAREATLNWLGRLNFDFGPVLPAIVEMAVSSSKRVRPLAVNVLRDFPDEGGRLLAEQLTAADASTRGYAAEALAAILGPAAESHLQSALASERAHGLCRPSNRCCGTSRRRMWRRRTRSSNCPRSTCRWARYRCRRSSLSSFASSSKPRSISSTSSTKNNWRPSTHLTNRSL